ncbi:MAG: hypothetical protein WBP47_24255, partial [Candidatus Promineifilaceae bacterium]
SGSWTTVPHSGGTVSISSENPYQGPYHLRLADYAEVQRDANLSDFSTATLSFYWTATKLKSDEAFYAEISANGGSSWTRIFTANSSNYQPSYALFTYSLNSTYRVTGFKIRFIGISKNDSSDYFDVDNITIVP